MAKQDSIAFSQRGLSYFPHRALFCKYLLDEEARANPETYPFYLELARITEEFCLSRNEPLVVVRGIDMNLWAHWCREHGIPVPRGFAVPTHMGDRPPFKNTPGDLYFHIKSRNPEESRALQQLIEEVLGDRLAQRTITVGHDRHGGRVFGGRFFDPLINPVDQVGLTNRVIVGDEDPDHRGAVYSLSQIFVNDWEMLDNMTELAKENMIGRALNNIVIPMEQTDSHIKCVRQLGPDVVNLRLLRQTLPYGRATDNRGDERGVHFAAYGKSPEVFERMINAIIGDRPGFIKDRMFAVTLSEAGHYWYVPPAVELGLDTGGELERLSLPPYFDVHSDNGFMYYNAKAFLKGANKGKATEGCPLSDRILLLIDRQFSRWHEAWYKKRETPPLGHLRDYLPEDECDLLTASVALRKGKAIQLSLSEVLISEAYSKRARLFTVYAKELIVGNMPQLSLGTGTQVMEYLDDDERVTFFFGMLNEYSSTGHNIPDYKKLITIGIDALKAQFQARLDSASGDQADFYQSVVWALEGLSAFIAAYADLAERQAAALPPYETENRRALEDIAKCMRHISRQAPTSFHQSLQLIFITNCALHQIGEPMSIGRLDQVLIDAYRADVKAGTLTPERAQEIMDAFWLKMDETVLLNRQHFPDYLNYGTGAVFYSAGNFPQGSANNQWVQQVTVGGFKANDAGEPEDACNEVTELCLRSAGRLPLNAPCLSLRLYRGSDPGIIKLAAQAILSGGAHPILFNDDKMVPALEGCGMERADARDFACDGCYEAIIPGKTEWAFSYVPILPFVGVAMNQGTEIWGAGPVHLRGMKVSWNSPPPEEIKSFEQFLEIFFTHYRWGIDSFFNTLMNSYGSLAAVCPSPLFSSLVHDCLETGRDMTDGGAKYHIVAPMMCGITNTINSLYSIKRLVYDSDSAITTLPELLHCLMCNWGQNMIEPLNNKLAGKDRADLKAQRYAYLREQSLALPKFGDGKDPEVVNLAKTVVGTCVDMIHRRIDDPIPAIGKGYAALKKKYDLPNKPFRFTVTPGVGTFEDNTGLGLTMGASADGRALSEPIADDFSPAPSPQDLPVEHAPRNVFRGLADWNIEPIGLGIANAAPVDINILEDFPLPTLERVIREFADGKIGSNLLTVTTANPDTLTKSTRFPEAYDLVRVRMGGWTEFMVAMFPEHQQHMRRRPLFVVGDGDE